MQLDQLDSYGTCLRGVASISAPFNLVVPIILGVLAVHNKMLDCLWCSAAIVTHFYGILQKSDDAEVDKLVRWLSEVTVAGFVCKSLCRVVAKEKALRRTWPWYLLAALSVCFLGFREECITTINLEIYYLSTCVMQALRAALQIV